MALGQELALCVYSVLKWYLKTGGQGLRHQEPPLSTICTLNLFFLHRKIKGPALHTHYKNVLCAREGLVRGLNPGPLPPKARRGAQMNTAIKVSFFTSLFLSWGKMVSPPGSMGAAAIMLL